MIQVPTPQQHALVAQMLQGMLGQPKQNPNVLQQGGRYLVTPGAAGPGGDSNADNASFGHWQNMPTVATQGYAAPAGSAAVMEDPAQAPASVFGRMRQSLPDATRSATYSHQQALLEQFMRNTRAAKMKGVRK